MKRSIRDSGRTHATSSQAIKAPKGRVRTCYLRAGDTPRQLSSWSNNMTLLEWGAIVGHLLLRHGLTYGIGGMYLEFENAVAPDAVVSPPALVREPGAGIDYYNELALSPNRDYLRVPLVSGTLTSSDSSVYPLGNVASFFAQSVSATGVHDRPFADTSNSIVFGAALVAFVAEDDPTRDIVFARHYFALDKQKLKLPTSQVGIEWQQRFV